MGVGALQHRRKNRGKTWHVRGEIAEAGEECGKMIIGLEVKHRIAPFELVCDLNRIN